MKRNSRAIKTLREIEEQDKKNWNALKRWSTFLVFVLIVCLLFLLSTTMYSCASRPANAQSYYRGLQKDTTELRAIIRAYNHLVHQIWIDKPNYFEEALMESNEFMELNDLLYSQWGDTFEFYNEDDSIRYHRNWITGDGRFEYEEVEEGPNRYVQRWK